VKPALSWLQLSNSHVRNWHIADVPLGLTNVDFWGQKRTVTNRCLPISIYEYTAWSRLLPPFPVPTKGRPRHRKRDSGAGETGKFFSTSVLPSHVHGKMQAEREARTCIFLSVTGTTFNI
jgi:hypothetical protein